jgi:hypothetical protein
MTGQVAKDDDWMRLVDAEALTRGVLELRP